MIPILYLDNAILVCVKPADILSQGAPEGGTDLPVLLSRQCGGQVYPIHRLDRGVGGVMVYARTKPAAGALSRAVQLGALKKEYLCIVSGGPEAAEGIYRDLLFHDSTRNKTFVVQRLRKGVKEASLSYRAGGLFGAKAFGYGDRRAEPGAGRRIGSGFSGVDWWRTGNR